MPIYECRSCGLFASLSPGHCWKCGRILARKGPPPGAPPPAHGPAGPPGPGTKPLYRCNACAKFASLTPGACVLCGTSLTVHHVPFTEAGGIANLLTPCERILSAMLNATNRLETLLNRVARYEAFVAQPHVPRSLVGTLLDFVVGDTLHTQEAADVRVGLQTFQAAAQDYRRDLLALRESLAARRVGTLATVGYTELRGLVNQMLEILEEQLALVNEALRKLQP